MQREKIGYTRLFFGLPEVAVSCVKVGSAKKKTYERNTNQNAAHTTFKANHNMAIILI
jgi:hypothetical protein